MASNHSFVGNLLPESDSEPEAGTETPLMGALDDVEAPVISSVNVEPKVPPALSGAYVHMGLMVPPLPQKEDSPIFHDYWNGVEASLPDSASCEIHHDHDYHGSEEEDEDEENAQSEKEVRMEAAKAKNSAKKSSKEPSKKSSNSRHPTRRSN